MTRNDTIATVSNITLLASISPYSDQSTAGPDVDVYSASAAPGSIFQFYVDQTDEFVQPLPNRNSMQPVTFFMRVSDARGDARPDFIYTFNVFGVN